MKILVVVEILPDKMLLIVHDFLNTLMVLIYLSQFVCTFVKAFELSPLESLMTMADFMLSCN